jgi:transcriptional regulator with XRE-family HTH domain
MCHMSNTPDGLPTWSFADRLRKIRRDRHLTQEQIAREIGVKAVTWASWEANRNRPGDVVEVAARIERRYGVPAAWTLGVLGSSDRRVAPAVPPQADRRRWTDPPVFRYGMTA